VRVLCYWVPLLNLYISTSNYFFKISLQRIFQFISCGYTCLPCLYSFQPCLPGLATLMADCYVIFQMVPSANRTQAAFGSASYDRPKQNNFGYLRAFYRWVWQVSSTTNPASKFCGNKRYHENGRYTTTSTVVK